MKSNIKLRNLIREYIRKEISSHQLNESFKSGILRNLLTKGSKWRNENWAQIFYNYTKVGLDQIQDSDFVEMDPITAYKNLKKSGSPKIVFYVASEDKTNPYGKGYSSQKIGAGTLIGVATDQNSWYGYEASSGKRFMKAGSNAGDIGIQKQGSGYGSTGIYNVKRGAELSDVAYVLDLLSIQKKYSTSDKVELRTKQKSGAVAFMTAKEFKIDNQRRYQEILSDRAAGEGQDAIIKGVQAAIQTVTSKVSDAVGNMTTGKYNNIVIGVNPKGVEVTASDAANFLRSLLNDFERYIEYSKQSSESSENDFYADFYARKEKTYALELKKSIQKVVNNDYA